MVGFGYDSHKFKSNGRLLIGGVEISDKIGIIAHSDGDVLLHALIDAILGATGNGDIGSHFPDTDIRFENADSMTLLQNTLSLIKDFDIINIDATIILENIKLAPFKEEIRQKIANVCNINVSSVNIKAKTNETMGFVGRNEGIVCYCICQIEKRK